MTKDEFLDALDWAIAATVDRGGYVAAGELVVTLEERLRWLEVVEPRAEEEKRNAD